MDGETYPVEVFCKNCGTPRMLQIPKGTLVQDYMEHQMQELVCDNCGCKLTRVIISSKVWNP